MDVSEALPGQRHAIIVWHLAHGETFRTWQVAEMFGMSQAGAYAMMCRISQCLPIHIYHGAWRVCMLRELGENDCQDAPRGL